MVVCLLCYLWLFISSILVSIQLKVLSDILSFLVVIYFFWPPSVLKVCFLCVLSFDTSFFLHCHVVLTTKFCISRVGNNWPQFFTLNGFLNLFSISSFFALLLGFVGWLVKLDCYFFLLFVVDVVVGFLNNSTSIVISFLLWIFQEVFLYHTIRVCFFFLRYPSIWIINCLDLPESEKRIKSNCTTIIHNHRYICMYI